MNKKISRRKMLGQIVASFFIPVSVLWYLGTKRKIDLVTKKKIVLPNNLADGVTFLEDVTIVKSDKEILALSSKCTHLGCKINNVINDELICSCHGSKFNLKGVPIIGPATKPLKTLKIEKDKLSEKMVLYA